MECAKKSKGWMTELIEASEIHNYKPRQLESVLEVLHATIKGGRDNETAEENFMTVYEAVRANNLGINLEPFQKTYESLCKKYKIT